MREVRRSRKNSSAGLRSWASHIFPAAGNFILVYFGERAKEIVAALARKGILLRDRSSDFGGEGYVRITVGTLAQTRRLLRELKEIL